MPRKCLVCGGEHRRKILHKATFTNTLTYHQELREAVHIIDAELGGDENDFRYAAIEAIENGIKHGKTPVKITINKYACPKDKGIFILEVVCFDCGYGFDWRRYKEPSEDAHLTGELEDKFGITIMKGEADALDFETYAFGFATIVSKRVSQVSSEVA